MVETVVGAGNQGDIVVSIATEPSVATATEKVRGCLLNTTLCYNDFTVQAPFIWPVFS